MSLVINTNLNALAAQNSAGMAAKAQSKAMQRLSTGLSINSAADDAAGLAISNRMTSNINGLGKAIKNANDGINMAQTADSALSNTTAILQRMRELAVQASNGTSTDANRQAIQAEVSQLKTQIDQIGQTTNFNDINLLDGSAGNVSLQVGVNQGQTMSMNFDSILTKDIGLGSRASLTSLGNIAIGTNNGVKNTAMSYGDLTVNGVLVGPSLKTSDQLSSTLGDSSAIAKAAAINAVSAQTGVTATVTGTTVQGSSMTLAAAASTGTITINGVVSAQISTSQNDLSLSRKAIVTAINNMTAETGVTAVDSGNDQHGVQLTAADGRNITIYTTLLQTSTGLNASNSTTYSGTFQLASASNSPIVIGSQVGGNLGAANLTAGTYAANTAQVTSASRAVSSTYSSIGAVQSNVGKLTSNSLVLNGIAIGAAISSDDTASDTTAASSYKSESAIAFAAAVNKSSNLTGVKAVANANTIVGSSFQAGTIGTSIYLNGVTIANTLGTSGYKVADVANLLNAYSGQTGVVASDNGKGLTLTAADGRNISIGEQGVDVSYNALGISSNSGPVKSGAASAKSVNTTYGTISLQSTKQFTVESGSDSDSNLNLIGLSVGTFGGSANGLKIAQVDVSTQQGAESAISAIDAALTTVSLNQSKAGAFINRLNDIVTNQTSMQSNMTTSRSAIQDTDYSAETTNLAKSQIISQAATAMLAQANQSSQNVLALLK
jgi:flagellin